MTTPRKLVARYKAADILTKEWLMGVRRGWLKLLDPPIGDWDDVHKAYRNLGLFVKNLNDQVFYARRGPYTGSPTMSEGKKVQDLLKKLSGAISELGSRAKHWQTVQEGRSLPGFNQEDGERMLNLYRTNFPGANEVALETSPGKWRNVNPADLMDKVLKILREDVKRIKDHDEANPTDPYQDTSVYKEFDLHGLKVVIDDSTVLPSEIHQYIRYLDEAYQRLKQKGFGKVWYGTVFIKCEKCGGTNQYGPELGVGGNYPVGPDVVNVFSRPTQFIVELMAHELGHRYWFKFMSQAQRAKFEDLINIEPRKPVEFATLIPDSKGAQAKAMVDASYDTLKRLLKDFGSSRLKWWVDIIKKFEEPLIRAGYKANDDLITAMQYPQSWLDKPEVRKFHEDVLKASRELTNRLTDMDRYIRNEIHKTPEPAVAPERLDVYWLSLFKPMQKWWIEDTLIQIEGVITAAYIFIDVSIAAHNQNEIDRNETAIKRWEDAQREQAKRVSPVTDYGGKHIDEAFAEAFAHYVLDKNMTRDQIESFKAVLKTATLSRIVRRYKLALTLGPEAVDRWRKDLRLITKIYKGVDSLEEFEKARRIILTFRTNFEAWVYKTLLPRIEKDRETGVHRQVKKLAWDALFHIAITTLFPSTWNYQTKEHEPSLYELERNRDRNIARYNKAFNAAFKAIDEYLQDNQGKLERTPDQHYDIAGMSVLVTGYGRDADDEEPVESFLRRLRGYGTAIERAGFRDAVKGLKVELNFDPTEAETGAKYSPSKDRMTVYPLGLAGSGTGGTFTHEVGHRYWFRSMTPQGRAYWEEVMGEGGFLIKIEREDVEAFLKFVQGTLRDGWVPDTDELKALVRRSNMDEGQKAKFRELIRIPPYNLSGTSKGYDVEDHRRRLMNLVGEPILLEEVSDYANSGGPIESFAEVFKHYVLKGPGSLGAGTLAAFKRSVGSGGVKL